MQVSTIMTVQRGEEMIEVTAIGNFCIGGYPGRDQRDAWLDCWHHSPDNVKLTERESEYLIQKLYDEANA